MNTDTLGHEFCYEAHGLVPRPSTPYLKD